MENNRFWFHLFWYLGFSVDVWYDISSGGVLLACTFFCQDLFEYY